MRVNYKKINIICSLLCVLFFLWASLFNLEQGYVFNARLINNENTLVIDSNLDGVLSELYVKETDELRQGQLLFIIDSDINSTTKEKLKNEINQISEKIIKNEKIKMVLDKEKNIIQQRIESFEKLENEGFINELYFVEFKNKKNQNDLKIIENENELSDLINTKKTKEFNLQKLNSKQNSSEILSPVNGKVSKIYMKKGRSIKQTNKVLEIETENEDKILSAKINPMYINNFNLGDKFKAKVVSDDQVEELYECELFFINLESGTSQQEFSFYEMKFKVISNIPKFEKGTVFEISTSTGNETFFDYLFKPIKKILKKSFNNNINNESVII